MKTDRFIGTIDTTTRGIQIMAIESSLGYHFLLNPVIEQLLESCGGRVIEATRISDEWWITAGFVTIEMQELFAERLAITIDVFQSHINFPTIQAA